MQGVTRQGGRPRRDHMLAYKVREVLCKSHKSGKCSANRTRRTWRAKTARAGKEPKGKYPYASLDEARGALGSDFYWKNVHFREVRRAGLANEGGREDSSGVCPVR